MFQSFVQYFIINILVSFFYRPISLWSQTRSAHLTNVKMSQGLARNRLIEMSEHYFCCGLGITWRTLTLHNCKTWAPAQKKKKNYRFGVLWACHIFKPQVNKNLVEAFYFISIITTVVLWLVFNFQQMAILIDLP